MGRNRKQNKREVHSFDEPEPSPTRGTQPRSTTQATPFSWTARELVNGQEIFTPEQEQFVQSWTQKFSDAVGGGLYTAHIEKNLRSVVFQAETLSDQTLLTRYINFLDWHPNVKKNAESWKQAITGNRYSAASYQVCTATGKRSWGGDDGIYRANPELQILVPRGCVFGFSPENRVELILFANRKFYGKTSGDEDDGDLTSESIREGNYTDFLISTKANGESAQVALCPFDNSVWVIGSKNRKIAVKTRDQVGQYRNDSQYLVAVQAADVFFNYLEKLSAEKLQELKNLLSVTRWTLNFEFENPNYQHIVRLFEAQLVLIGCSGIHISSGRTSHPIIGCAIARYFGFGTVLGDLTVYPKDQLEIQCQRVTRQWHSEGVVLVLLDQLANVVDLVKVKSWWYILLRAIREKLRVMKTEQARIGVKSKIVQRIKTLQNSMNIAPEYADAFSRLGCAFTDWLVEIKQNEEEYPRLTNLMPLYPVRWEEFLQAKQLPSDNSIIENARQILSGDVSSAKYRENLPLLVLLQGIPGVGKSFLGKGLTQALNQAGYPCLDIAQDDFTNSHGAQNSGKACLAFVRNSLLSGNYRCIILARNNGNAQQYSNYVALESEEICKVCFIHPAELVERIPEVVYLSMAGLLYRKQSGENHPTSTMSDCDLASLAGKFFGSINIHPSGFSVKLLRDDPLPIPNLENFLAVLKVFQRDGFKAKSLTNADLSKFQLDSQQNISSILNHRRNFDLVLNDCLNFLIGSINTALPPFASYMSVHLHSDSSQDIVKFASQFFPNQQIPPDWNVSADHVTLVHSINFLTHKETWFQAEEIIGKNVQVIPEFVVSNDKVFCVKVSLRSQDGENLDYLVASKVPHVTIATAPKVRSFDSIAHIQNSSPESRIVITEPILHGLIDLII